MTRTLEQVVRDVLKAWDVDVEPAPRITAILGLMKYEKTTLLFDELRAALKEREKRLPYQVTLENGLAEIRQRLERIEKLIYPRVD